MANLNQCSFNASNRKEKKAYSQFSLPSDLVWFLKVWKPKIIPLKETTFKWIIYDAKWIRIDVTLDTCKNQKFNNSFSPRGRMKQMVWSISAYMWRKEIGEWGRMPDSRVENAELWIQCSPFLQYVRCVLLHVVSIPLANVALDRLSYKIWAMWDHRWHLCFRALARRFVSSSQSTRLPFCIKLEITLNWIQNEGENLYPVVWGEMYPISILLQQQQQSQ